MTSGDPEILVDSALAEAVRLMEAQHFDEVLHVLRRAVAIATSAPGLDPDYLGTARYMLGLQLYARNEWAEALPHLEAGANHLERNYGAVNQLRGDVLNALGRCHQELGVLDAAIDCYYKAVEILAAVLGPRDPHSITVLDNLAYVVELTGNLDEALELAETVWAARAEVLGPAADETLDSHHAVASLHEKRGDFQNAAEARELEYEVRRRRFGAFDESTLDTSQLWFETLLEAADVGSALAVMNRIAAYFEDSSTMPDERRSVANTLRRMGVRAERQGYPELLLTCAERAHVMLSSAFGPEDPDSIDALGGLAQAHFLTEDYGTAIRLNRLCLDQRRALLPADDPDIALSLNNLAAALHDQGELIEALPLWEEALRIDRVHYKEPDDVLAADMHNIGRLLVDLRRYREGLTYLWRAVDQWKSLHPEGHLHLGHAFKILFFAYHRLGDVAAAARCEAQFRRLYAEFGREEHLQLPFAKDLDSTAPTKFRSTALEAQGDERLQAGDPAGALRYFSSAIETGKMMGRYSSVDECRQQWKTAVAHKAAGAYDEALDSATQAMSAFRNAWLDLPVVGSVTEHGMLLGLGERLKDLVLTLLVEHTPQSKACAHAAFELVLQSKALASTILQRERHAAFEETRPEVQERFRRLQTLQLQIADQLLTGPRSASTAFSKELIEEWQLEIRKVSAELASRTMTTKHVAQPDGLVSSILEAMPQGAGLIEAVYAHKDRVETYNEPLGPVADIFHSFYVIFFLSTAHPDRLQWVAIPRRDIDDPVFSLRTALEQDVDDDEWLKACRALRHTVLDPFKGIEDCERIFFAPDGQLTTIPLDLLPAAGRGTLMETTRVVYLRCGRELLETKQPHNASRPVVMGAPDYDLAGDEPIRRDTLHALAMGLSLAARSGIYGTGIRCEARNKRRLKSRVPSESNQLPARTLTAMHCSPCNRRSCYIWRPMLMARLPRGWMPRSAACSTLMNTTCGCPT